MKDSIGTIHSTVKHSEIVVDLVRTGSAWVEAIAADWLMKSLPAGPTSPGPPTGGSGTGGYVQTPQAAKRIAWSG
ncbi:hypothetical protein GCM10027300_19840 [Modestobacter lapidis]